MKKNRLLVVCVVLVTLVGLVQGCSRGPSEEELKFAAFQEQYAGLKQAYDGLTDLRTELEAAEATVATLEEIPEQELTEEQVAELETLKARLEGGAAESETGFEEVQGLVADLLNVGINEYPESQETADALMIYSDEAILVAIDMVEKSGDYKKAIDNLTSAQGFFEAAGLTPYHPLVAQIEEFDSWRFITQERFDAATKGMTKEEVVAVAGQVYYRNVQESPDKGVETWLYKKREGGAAAFYFKMKTQKLYDKNWEAVSTQVVTD